MLNNGLDDLRLVAPRDGWPNPDAEPMASGATLVLEKAQLFETTREAVADLNFVMAATARERDMSKRAYTPKGSAIALKLRHAPDRKTGVIFGPERSGLVNEDVILADGIIHVPLNPEFSSLNLSQAVLLVAYEWYQLGVEMPTMRTVTQSPAPSIEAREYFLDRLDKELDAAGFLFPPELAPTISKNIRNVFTRAELSDQELRTLHGVVTALLKHQSDDG